MPYCWLAILAASCSRPTAVQPAPSGRAYRTPHSHTPTLPHSQTPTLPHSQTPTPPHPHTLTPSHPHTLTPPKRSRGSVQLVRFTCMLHYTYGSRLRNGSPGVQLILIGVQAQHVSPAVYCVGLAFTRDAAHQLPPSSARKYCMGGVTFAEYRPADQWMRVTVADAAPSN